jgi:hypothetical protein
VFIYYVGKFGGKHGELEFGRGLRQTEFCTTDINGRIVGEVKVGHSFALLQNNFI